MNILDALIIIFLLIGALTGFSRGLIKQGVLLVGLIVVLVLSFYIRIPVSNFFYKNLPFFNFDGVFKGMSVLNILIYESMAFLIVFSVLYIVLRIIIKISGLIEKILKATIILGFFSKLGGLVVGAIESYVIMFIILFVASQPFLKVTGMEDSKFTPIIVNKSPFLSDAVEDFRFVFDEIEKNTKVSLVSIPKAVCNEVIKRGYKKVGLLGTIFTMEQDFMKKDLLQAGIDVVVPDKNERELIAKRIFEELEYGIVKESTLQEFNEIIKKMQDEYNIEAVILGCTELPLILNDENCLLPCLDSVAIHIERLVELAQDEI